MSDDDLIRVLRNAEASAVRVVEPPGVDAVHRALRRKRRNRAVLACLVLAGVIFGSVAVLAARAEQRVPPINPITPSTEPAPSPSEAFSPTPQVVAAPATTASTNQATQCTRNPIGADGGLRTVVALDVSGRVWPICDGVGLRVMWASYRIDPGTTTGHLHLTGEIYLDSGRSSVTVSPRTPPGCSWWVIIASNTVTPPGTLDVANINPRTPQSPFWDYARGRDAHVSDSTFLACPNPSGTPSP